MTDRSSSSDAQEATLAFRPKFDEAGLVIAQANAKVDEKGEFVADVIQCRQDGEFIMNPPSEIDYMDISPSQLVSISAGLIPFLEHDDANRALMGSNMMRQAVPLMKPQAPIVGTGLEKRVALDSRSLILAEGNGVVDYVDANKISIKYDLNANQKLISFDDEV